MWSRLVYGARVSLTVGLISQGIALSLGITMGLLAGFYGGWVDEIVMRLADVTLAFPTLLLLIAMVAALQPSEAVVFATIGIVGWAGMARIVRGQVLVVRQLEYIQAIRALGAGDLRIMTQHILPNVVAPVVIAATLGVAGAKLGVDDCRWARPRPTSTRAVDVSVSGSGDRCRSPRLQSARRCAT